MSVLFVLDEFKTWPHCGPLLVMDEMLQPGSAIWSCFQLLQNGNFKRFLPRKTVRFSFRSVQGLNESTDIMKGQLL